jgi:thymidylate synthase (FAD)
MKVTLISLTTPAPHLVELGIKTPDDIMVYTARASSPENQVKNLNGPRLLNYCIRNGHWSVFDMADMTIEVVTSRALSAQVVRHWSFDGLEVTGDFRFQEFSQRYAQVTDFETYEARAPHAKNRQLSEDTLPEDVKAWFRRKQLEAQAASNSVYLEALERGIAKECARFVLPMSAQTKFYMKGSARSWIHYLKLRRKESGAQAEHVDIADDARVLFKQHFPMAYEGAFDIHED